MKKLLFLFISILLFTSCGDTYVPDDGFEQALIDLGYDDVLDDYVPTVTIKNITELKIGSNDSPPIIPLRINDFTGLEDFASLENLDLNYTHGAVLDVSGLTSLKRLVSIYGPYDITFENNVNLEVLEVGQSASGNDSFTTSPPDFSEAPKLVSVSLYFLWGGAALDFSDNPDLRSIYLLDTAHSVSDLSLNPLLEEIRINVHEPPVTYTFTGGLDGLNLPRLRYLQLLGMNYIGSQILDLSNCPTLEELQLFGASFRGLNLKNGNNRNILRINFPNDSNSEECIQVDDPRYSESNWTGRSFIFKSGRVFSTDCRY